MAFVRKHNWEAIRKEVEEGIPMIQVGKRFKVSAQVIRSKAQKEQWATPARVQRQMKELVGAGVIEKSSPTATAQKNPEFVESITKDSESVLDPRDGYAAAVAYHIAKKVQRALPSMPDPRSWRDLNTADSMARRAMGLDKQVVRAAGIFGGSGSQTGFALEITSNDSLDTCADTAENGWFDDQGAD